MDSPTTVLSIFANSSDEMKMYLVIYSVKL